MIGLTNFRQFNITVNGMGFCISAVIELLTLKL